MARQSVASITISDVKDGLTFKEINLYQNSSTGIPTVLPANTNNVGYSIQSGGPTNTGNWLAIPPAPAAGNVLYVVNRGIKNVPPSTIFEVDTTKNWAASQLSGTPAVNGIRGARTWLFPTNNAVTTALSASNYWAFDSNRPIPYADVIEGDITQFYQGTLAAPTGGQSWVWDTSGTSNVWVQITNVTSATGLFGTITSAEFKAGNANISGVTPSGAGVFLDQTGDMLVGNVDGDAPSFIFFDQSNGLLSIEADIAPNRIDGLFTKTVAFAPADYSSFSGSTSVYTTTLATVDTSGTVGEDYLYRPMVFVQGTCFAKDDSTLRIQLSMIANETQFTPVSLGNVTAVFVAFSSQYYNSHARIRTGFTGAVETGDQIGVGSAEYLVKYVINTGTSYREILVQNLDLTEIYTTAGLPTVGETLTKYAGSNSEEIISFYYARSADEENGRSTPFSVSGILPVATTASVDIKLKITHYAEGNQWDVPITPSAFDSRSSIRNVSGTVQLLR